MTDYPTIYHPDLGKHIEIRNDLTFKAAKVFWDDIAARYSVTTEPVYLQHEVPVQVKPALIKTPKKKSGITDLRIQWTDAEMFVIQDLPSWRDAVAAYQKAFPDKRGDNSIKQQWVKINKGIVNKRSTTAPTEEIKKEPVPNPSLAKINALVVAKNGVLQPGMRVKYNGPHASPFAGKSGEIAKIGNKDQILVKFGETSSWLSKHLVIAIPEVPA